MANHQDHHTSTGRGPGYTQVGSRLRGAAQDVSELLDVLTDGLAADTPTSDTDAGEKAEEGQAGEAWSRRPHPESDRGDRPWPAPTTRRRSWPLSPDDWTTPGMFDVLATATAQHRRSDQGREISGGAKMNEGEGKVDEWVKDEWVKKPR